MLHEEVGGEHGERADVVRGALLVVAPELRAGEVREPMLSLTYFLKSG